MIAGDQRRKKPMSEQRVEQRLAEHAARCAAGFIVSYDLKCFRFPADGYCMEVTEVERGMDDGAPAWDWRVRDEESGLENARSLRKYATEADAMFDAWTCLAELIRALQTNEPPELTKERYLKAYDLLWDAYDLLWETAVGRRMSKNPIDRSA
jgi:hypothetical protein